MKFLVVLLMSADAFMIWLVGKRCISSGYKSLYNAITKLPVYYITLLVFFAMLGTPLLFITFAVVYNVARIGVFSFCCCL